MPNLAVGERLEARIVCTLGEQAAINVIHFRVKTIVLGTPTTLDAATAISGLIQAVYKALLTNSATFRGVGVRQYEADPLPSEDSYIGDLGAGTSGTDPMPPQVAGVLTKKSNFAGRSFRGRMYIPFPDESDNDTDHTPSATYIGNLNTLGLLLDGDNQFVGVGLDYTLTSLIRRAAAPGSIEWTSSRSNDKWGTQRRRGAYGRPNAPPF